MEKRSKALEETQKNLQKQAESLGKLVSDEQVGKAMDVIEEKKEEIFRQEV